MTQVRKFIRFCPPPDRKIFSYDKGYIVETDLGFECRYFDSLKFYRMRWFSSCEDALRFMKKEGYERL